MERCHLNISVVLQFFARFVLTLGLFVAGHAVSAETVATTATQDTGIRIGIVGDQTGTTDLNAAYGVLTQGVQLLSTNGVDVVIHVGDMLESSASESAIRAQYAQATGILGQLPVNWYMTAGDHDVNPPGFQQNSSDRSRETLFKELYGTHVPAAQTNLYYSFDVGNYHFISLYSLEALHSDPRWGNVYLNQISNAQFQWLKRDLQNHSGAKGIVVFLHHPMWYNWSAWQRVHDLLRKYPVAAVVGGHFHYDQSEGRLDGIRYVVVGATGGATKHGDRDAGDVQHVSVMTVKGSSVTDFDMFSLSDNLPLSLTPRKDMDKIQAVDIVLGELWNFASVNPVFRKADGSLVSACDSSTPAKIAINPIGNPTDRALDVRIEFSTSDSHAVLNSPSFTSGECQAVVSNFECVLAPSARIFVSNNSSVSVNTFAPPLWTATVGHSGTPPAAGTVLNFDIRLQYGGRSGPLALERRATTTIMACP